MVSVRKLVTLATASTLAAVTAASFAQAQPRRDPPPRPAPWRGDIHRFHEHDWVVWRSGHWYRGLHAGRVGWWWVVGGVWYFYPAPIYPYPNPYEPPPVASGPPVPQYWYHCDAPEGYYPYVPSCPSGWKQVPATPADAASTPQAQRP